LIQKTLEILVCTLENEPLKEAWCEVFCLCAVELSIEYLAVEVLPSIFTMFTMKNPLPIRIRSTKMILSIAKVSPLKIRSLARLDSTMNRKSLKTYAQCANICNGKSDR